MMGMILFCVEFDTWQNGVHKFRSLVIIHVGEQKKWKLSSFFDQIIWFRIKVSSRKLNIEEGFKFVFSWDPNTYNFKDII